MTETKPLLTVKHLKKYFPVKSGFLKKTSQYVKAVDNVSFEVFPGETVGIVGESGCGKSTLAKTLLRLTEPTEGVIHFNNVDVSSMNREMEIDFRKEVQIVFQDPYSSLNPRKTIRKILEEPLINLTDYTKAERNEIVMEAIQDVGLDVRHLNRYPHEFSGGQKQRIGIARALTVKPKLIVCDEAVSALDVSVQAQILNLLKELQRKYQLTYVFISHDLGVIKHFCDRVLVMYLGKAVEIADKSTLFATPSHPYTEALLSAVPSIHAKSERIKLHGEIPSPINPPSGCSFHTRCPIATDKCKSIAPELKPISENQWVSCLYR